MAAVAAAVVFVVVWAVPAGFVNVADVVDVVARVDDDAVLMLLLSWRSYRCCCCPAALVLLLLSCCCCPVAVVLRMPNSVVPSS